MPSRGLRGLWVRGVAAVAACLLALGSTGGLVTAAVVTHGGSGPAAILTSHNDGNGNGNGNDKSQGDGSSHGSGSGSGSGSSNGDGKGKGGSKTGGFSAVLAQLKADAVTAKAKASKDTPKPAAAKPVSHPKPTSHSSTSHPAGQQAPAPTPKVVVGSSDPAPFSAQAVSVNDAARVLPVESLGPLSGISFGSGLFIWPLLLAVDVFALAVIARMALRRRLVSPED
jgi:hypothetical protein